jgi:lipopolysaccharide export LptBFGC system permease protein LptF
VAAGLLPVDVVFTLLGFKMLNYVALLLSVAFYLALLLTLTFDIRTTR